MTDTFDDREPEETRRAGISRSHFLEIGAGGLAATLVAPTAAFAASSAREDNNPNRLLLRGGIVLTLDDAVGDFDAADVLVERGKIVAVGPKPRARGPGRRLRRKIVMPGFVDTHRHMWRGSCAASGPTTCSLDYLQTMLMGFALRRSRPEEVYLGDLIAALSAMNAGVTTMLDWSHINTTPAAHRRRDPGAAGLGDPRRLRVRAELLPSGPRDEPLSERHLPAARASTSRPRTSC